MTKVLYYYTFSSFRSRMPERNIAPVFGGLYSDVEKGDAVTKADIVNQIAEATGLTKTDTSAVVEGLLASVISAMQRGEHIEIRGFGTFKVVDRAPRTGRNPKTGDVVKIPSRPVPVFKPSRELRATVETEKVLSTSNTNS